MHTRTEATVATLLSLLVLSCSLSAMTPRLPAGLISKAPDLPGHIAYAHQDTRGYNIYVMNADGSEARLISFPTEGVAFNDPALSLDGKWVAFEWTKGDHTGLAVASLEGIEQETRLLPSTESRRLPGWTPNGQLLFSGKQPDGSWQIYQMNRDGGSPTRLTQASGTNSDPACSPDGRLIAFTSDRDGSWDIFVMNRDGTEQRNISNHSAHDGEPAWSPDGASIVFVSDRDGGFEIYSMSVDGSNVRQLTDNKADEGWPSWGPKGIAFQSDREGHQEVFVMNSDGTGQRRVTSDPVWQSGRPSWAQ